MAGHRAQRLRPHLAGHRLHEVDHRDAVLLVRRPDRRVHLVGAGELGEQLRQLLRGGVDGWRLHELPATQTPLTDAEPLLRPRVAGMLARYGFTTLEEIAAVPDLGLLDIRHFGPKTRLVVDAALAAYRLVDDPAIRRRSGSAPTPHQQPAQRRPPGPQRRIAGPARRAATSRSAPWTPSSSPWPRRSSRPPIPRVLQLLAAAGQPELAAVYARTRTPATPPPATDMPRGSSHDGHTSSGDADGAVEVDVYGSNDR